MNMRLKKVLDDIQKTEDKILELQEYVKKLKIQKKQMEDAEIIKAIRSMKMDSREMLTFLDGIQNGTVTMQFDEEGKTNYYCSDRSCPFALWKSNRFLESMKKSMDKKMAVELLKKGRTHVKGLYSKKKDSKFDADLVLGVEDGKARFSLEFPKKKTNSNKKKK